MSNGAMSGLRLASGPLACWLHVLRDVSLEPGPSGGRINRRVAGLGLRVGVADIQSCLDAQAATKSAVGISRPGR